MTASREFQEFYKMASSRVIPADLPLEQLRVDFDAWLKEFEPAPEVRYEPFSIGELDAVWAFAPEVNRRRILLFFFGGGFSLGSVESHKNIIGRLSAATSAAVCAIQYRLAPEHPYPAALDDALTAYRWLLHHPYARSRIVFAGISAGGNLALSLLLRLKMEKIAMPAGAICLCPWLDLTLKGDSLRSNNGKDLLKPEKLSLYVEKYCKDKNPEDPLISPIYGNFEGLPPLFIQTAMNDILYSDATAAASKAEGQGVSVTLDAWPGMVHAFEQFAPRFPEAQEAIDRTGEFVDRLFKHRDEGAAR